MGEPTVEFVNSLEFPLSDPSTRPAEGLQRFTGDGRGARRPGHRRRARRGAREDRVLERVQGARSRGGKSCRRTEASRAPGARTRGPDGGDRRVHRRRRPSVERRALAGRPLPLARPLPGDAGAGLAAAAAGRSGRGLLAGRARAGGLSRLLRGSPSSTSSSTWRSSSRSFVLGFWFLSYFENVAWAALVAVDHSLGRHLVVSSSGRPGRSRATSRASSSTSRSPSASPARNGTANLGPPDILFFALFVAAGRRFGLAPVWTWLAMTALIGVHAHPRRRRPMSAASRPSPRSRSASCSRTPTCSGTRCAGAGARRSTSTAGRVSSTTSRPT